MIQKLTPNRPLLAGLANEQGTGGTLTVTDGGLHGHGGCWLRYADRIRPDRSDGDDLTGASGIPIES